MSLRALHSNQSGRRDKLQETAKKNLITYSAATHSVYSPPMGVGA